MGGTGVARKPSEGVGEVRAREEKFINAGLLRGLLLGGKMAQSCWGQSDERG